MDVQIVLSVLSHMRRLRLRDHWTRKLVEVQRVESIPKTAAGKAPLIKSNLSRSSSLTSTADSGRSAKKAGT